MEKSIMQIKFYGNHTTTKKPDGYIIKQLWTFQVLYMMLIFTKK